MTPAAGALVAVLALGAAIGADRSASPAPSPDPALMAEIAEQQQADLARFESATITGSMRAESTFDLRPDEARWTLRPDDSTTSLETVVEEDEATTVRLTSDLLFRFGEHKVTEKAAEAVRDLLGDIPRGAKVAIDGHTDSIGGDASNEQLSGRRADAVADILRRARPDLRLTVNGHGERRPIAENEVGGKDNPAGRAQNRRVEVSYDSPAG